MNKNHKKISHSSALVTNPKIQNYSVNTDCATYTLLDKGFYYDQNGGINFEQELTINATISSGTANVIFRYGTTPVQQNPAITFTLLSSLQGSNVYKVEFKVVGPVPDNIWCDMSNYKTKLIFNTNCITTPTVNTTFTAEKSLDPDIYYVDLPGYIHATPFGIPGYTSVSYSGDYILGAYYSCHLPTLSPMMRSTIQYKLKTLSVWNDLPSSWMLPGSSLQIYDFRARALLRNSPLLYTPYYILPLQ